MPHPRASQGWRHSAYLRPEHVTARVDLPIIYEWPRGHGESLELPPAGAR